MRGSSTRAAPGTPDKASLDGVDPCGAASSAAGTQGSSLLRAVWAATQ